MKARKKSQAAMEFMITYGWVILIAVGIIAAIAAITDLNTLSFRSQKCEIYSSLKCLAFTIDNENLQIVLGNKAQEALIIKNASIIRDDMLGRLEYDPNGKIKIQRGTGSTATIEFEDAGKSVDGKIVINYFFDGTNENEDSNLHTAVGYILARG
jgi:hypothetical protein